MFVIVDLGRGVFPSLEHPLLTPQGSKVSSSSVFTLAALVKQNGHKRKFKIPDLGKKLGGKN